MITAFVFAFLAATTSIDLTVWPRVAQVPVTVRAEVQTAPRADARALCVVWESEEGESGEHCWPHVGDGAPIRERCQLSIGAAGAYIFRAYLFLAGGHRLASPERLATFI